MQWRGSLRLKRWIDARHGEVAASDNIHRMPATCAVPNRSAIHQTIGIGLPNAPPRVCDHKGPPVAHPHADPTVVVGIATHNRATLLPKAIKSALDQSYRPLRVAVIDDGSIDETPALREQFEPVSWERWDDAQGYVKARNRMMLGASEEYYVSLDDDARFIDGDEIEIAIEFMESRPSVAAVAFDIIAKWRPEKRPRGDSNAVRTFIGCGHILRLSVLKQLGGYA